MLLASMLFGPNNSGQNFGMALTWRVWWPLLPLSFFLLGRFWCAVCPFAWLTDQIQKLAGVRLPVPQVLRRYGIWLIAGGFIVITYLDEAWQFDSDARKSGCLLLVILAAVIFFGAFFERRTFCRHVCFIGAFAGNYSRAGILELRADVDRCLGCRSHDCYRGSARALGCPLFLFAPTMDDSATCQLCANCVKNCPRDAIRISLRKPAAELWNIRQPLVSDAVLAAIVAGAVLLEQFASTANWDRLVIAAGSVLHIDPYASSRIVDAALLAVFVAMPLLALLLASFTAQVLAGDLIFGSLKRNFSFFGYALIPLALAGHLSHSLDRLLSWSRAVPFAFAAMLNWFPANNGAAWLPRPAVLWIEIAVLLFGGALSLYVAFRLAHRQTHRAIWVACLPPFLLLLLLLAANLYAVGAITQQS